MDILECGKVLNTHGIRGELKVDNYCDDGFFKKIKTFFQSFLKVHDFAIYFCRFLSVCAVAECPVPCMDILLPVCYNILVK